MAATWAEAGCNTNLGILLLCAPVAAAVEHAGACTSAAALRAAIAEVMRSLDVADARAAYRAIALANPGGLGDAPSQDVHDEPSVGLREAMALAAARDRIALPVRERPRGPVRHRPGGLALRVCTRAEPAGRGSGCGDEGRGSARLPGLSRRHSRFTHCSKTRRGRGTHCHDGGAGVASPFFAR